MDSSTNKRLGQAGHNPEKYERWANSPEGKAWIKAQAEQEEANDDQESHETDEKADSKPSKARKGKDTGKSSDKPGKAAQDD